MEALHKQSYLTMMDMLIQIKDDWMCKAVTFLVFNNTHNLHLALSQWEELHGKHLKTLRVDLATKIYPILQDFKSKLNAALMNVTEVKKFAVSKYSDVILYSMLWGEDRLILMEWQEKVMVDTMTMYREAHGRAHERNAQAQDIEDLVKPIPPISDFPTNIYKELNMLNKLGKMRQASLQQSSRSKRREASRLRSRAGSRQRSSSMRYRAADDSDQPSPSKP